MLRVLAIVLGVGSCLPMLAMLPSAVATLAGVVGLHAASGPAAPLALELAPVARGLLAAATVSLVLAALRCGIRPAALATAGGTLLYLSMYVLPRGATASMAQMGASARRAGTAAARAGAHGATNGPIFYAGLAAIAATYLWSGLRHRRRRCRPVSASRLLGTLARH